jgi:hypothetical protein
MGKWEIQEIIVSRVCRGLGNGGGRGMGDENLFSDVLNPTAGLEHLQEFAKIHLANIVIW